MEKADCKTPFLSLNLPPHQLPPSLFLLERPLQRHKSLNLMSAFCLGWPPGCILPVLRHFLEKSQTSVSGFLKHQVAHTKPSGCLPLSPFNYITLFLFDVLPCPLYLMKSQPEDKCKGPPMRFIMKYIN